MMKKRASPFGFTFRRGFVLCSHAVPQLEVGRPDSGGINRAFIALLVFCRCCRSLGSTNHTTDPCSRSLARLSPHKTKTQTKTIKSHHTQLKRQARDRSQDKFNHQSKQALPHLEITEMQAPASGKKDALHLVVIGPPGAGTIIIIIIIIIIYIVMRYLIRCIYLLFI